MLNELTISRGLPLSNGVGRYAEAPPVCVVDDRAALRDALQSDDLAAFERLLAHSALNVADTVFDGGQNCFHVAVKSGSTSIVLYLVQLPHAWVGDLINGTDDVGGTPLSDAVAVHTDNPALAEALLGRGADIEDALGITIQRDDLPVTAKAKAVTVLRSLGVDVARALSRASEKNRPYAIRILSLLGGKGSLELVAAAVRNDANALRQLIEGGADIVDALVIVAKALDVDGARNLVRAIEAYYGHIKGCDEALSRLADCRDIAAMGVLIPLVDTDSPACDALADSGDVQAIRVLIARGLMQPEQALTRCVFDGRLVGARTLVAADVDTLPLLQKLVKKYLASRRDDLTQIEVLMAARADLSTLPNEIADRLNTRTRDRSGRVPQDKTEALRRAMINGDVVEVARLYTEGADPVALLKSMNKALDWGCIATLINAGMNSPEALIGLAAADKMEAAWALAIVKRNVSTQALVVLMKRDGPHISQAFVRLAVLSGREVLFQAVQSNNLPLAKRLFAVGVDGPEALLWLLKSGKVEAAGVLIALDVDIHETLRRVIRMDDTYGEDRHSGQATVADQLIIIGADLAIVLRRAMAANDIQTATKLIRKDPSVGQELFWQLVEDPTLTRAEKRAGVKFLRKAGFNTDAVLAALADGYKIAPLRELIALGVPTDALMMEFGKQGNRPDAQTLIVAGADFTKPIRIMLDNHETTAVNTLVMAVNWARESRGTAQRSTAILV